MGGSRGGWGQVNIYLRRGDRERLELAVSLGRVKGPSELFRRALDEISRSLDPEQDLRELDSEISKLEAQREICAQYARNQRSRLNDVKDFLEKYKAYRRTVRSPANPEAWISARREDLPDSLKKLDAEEVVALLDRMLKEPDLTAKQLEELVKA